MDTDHDNLNKLTDKNPFAVPPGYMEGLTDRIMSQLPEKQHQEAKKISFVQQMLPWLYMAAMFAGIGLFLKVMIGPDINNGKSAPESAVATTTQTIGAKTTNETVTEEEYIDYMKDQYDNYLLAELSLSE